MSPRRAVAVAAALALAAGIAVVAWPGEEAERDRPELGLLTSLPIYWGESESIAEALDGGGNPHWARRALEAEYRLKLLDTLDDPALARLDRLLMAQPRPLAPAENVALDRWVRGGGRLLLFADPLLTEHSRFGLGDKRRPQDVVLLSPILRRWGLELQVDPEQSERDRVVRFREVEVPVRLGGSWRTIGGATSARCRLEAESIVADCTIGRGRAVIVADAALMESERDSREALDSLRGAAFAR